MEKIKVLVVTATMNAGGLENQLMHLLRNADKEKFQKSIDFIIEHGIENNDFDDALYKSCIAAYPDDEKLMSLITEMKNLIASAVEKLPCSKDALEEFRNKYKKLNNQFEEILKEKHEEYIRNPYTFASVDR